MSEQLTPPVPRRTKSPADKLVANKQRKRKPRNHAAPKRNAPFHCAIRERREALNLSLRDVADALSMSIAGLHAIEHGSDPMLSTAFRLCVFYGVEINKTWSLK